jgi:hypothetical protein
MCCESSKSVWVAQQYCGECWRPKSVVCMPQDMQLGVVPGAGMCAVPLGSVSYMLHARRNKVYLLFM